MSMARKINDGNEDNLKKLKEINTKPPVMPLIDQLAAEGLALLELEAMPPLSTQSGSVTPAKTVVIKPLPDDSKKLDATLAANSNNPYIRARATVLKKYNQWRQKEIERMESSGDINNRYYDQFVREVRELGDSLSDKK